MEGKQVKLSLARRLPAPYVGNPWGYNFECCDTITNPPPDVCGSLPCIASFWSGTGYVVQCSDGFSKTGGRPGACSYHGGNYAISRVAPSSGWST